MDNCVDNVARELTDTVTLLNDIYFESVKKIYNADFRGAKNTFLKTEGELGKVIGCIETIKKYYPQAEMLDINELMGLVEEIVKCFEEKNPQLASDLMLFDLCSVLNGYSDEVDKIITTKG